MKKLDELTFIKLRREAIQQVKGENKKLTNLLMNQINTALVNKLNGYYYDQELNEVKDETSNSNS